MVLKNYAEVNVKVINKSIDNYYQAVNHTQKGPENTHFLSIFHTYTNLSNIFYIIKFTKNIQK